MATVQTIRGPIAVEGLGMTLSHEHLIAGSGTIDRMPKFYNEDEAYALNLQALERARAAGVQSMIDLTTMDLGRQVRLFQRVAEADTGVNLVCATGVYRWVPAYFLGGNPDDIAEFLLGEIQDGIEGTGIRAGIIKLAWDLEYRLDEGPWSPRSALERCARGAARAAKAAGVPISCHTLATDELGTPLLDLFEDEGLDLAAVTIGHSNDTTDLGYLGRIAGRGANLGFDRYGGVRDDAENERRAALAKAMFEAGYGEQVSLGHDGSPYMRFGGIRPTNLDCWTYVPRHEVPWLLLHGLTEDQVAGMTVRSIRRTFEAAAAMKRD
ncbi:MAG: phosphotriesterase [Dehalococcoidia bacterium]